VLLTAKPVRFLCLTAFVAKQSISKTAAPLCTANKAVFYFAVSPCASNKSSEGFIACTVKRVKIPPVSKNDK